MYLVLKTDVSNAITKCLGQLYNENYNRRSLWQNKVTLSRKREEKYEYINIKLLENALHEPDNQIILDAHDYNLNTDEPVDFVTFDKSCYECAVTV